MQVPDALRRWSPYGLITLAVFLVWGHTVSFQFVWDDRCFIEELESIRSFSNVPAMFYSLEAQSSYPEAFVLFRPLRTLHYAVLFALGGGDSPRPWLFHFANVLWHLAASLLLYRVLRLAFVRIGPQSETTATGGWISLLGAIAFAVHPVTSEAVSWAKCLDDLMATTFVLASCGRLLRAPDEPENARHYWLALLYFGLAIYSKESAVPFALVSFLLLAWRHGSFRQGLRWSAPFFVLALVFVVHRHFVIGRTSQTTPISGTYWQTLIDTLPAVPIYARLLGGIPPFCIDYSYMKTGHALTAGAVLAGVALVVLALGLCLLVARPRTRMIGAGFLWLVLFLLPVSNLIPSMQFCAERFLYLPLLGWIAALAGTFMIIPVRRLAVVGSSVVIIGWAALAWNRSWIWQDPVVLFVQSHIDGPTSVRLKDNAVAAVFSQPHMRTVFKGTRRPGRPIEVFANPQADADWVSVERTLAQARELFPDDTTVATGLAITHLSQGRANEAVVLFDEIVRRHPESALAWQNLGQALARAGDIPRAADAFRGAIRAQPDYVPAWKRLAGLQWEQEDFAAARESFTRLQTLEPQNPEYERKISEAEEKLARLSAAGH